MLLPIVTLASPYRISYKPRNPILSSVFSLSFLFLILLYAIIPASFWNPSIYRYFLLWGELAQSHSHLPTVLSYLQDTWLIHKKKFVTAWIDHFFHLGNTTTSRIEGAHAVLKGYLQVSTGDLYAATGRLKLALENQHKNISAMISSERLRVPHDLHLPMFSGLINRVSHFALRKMKNELLKATRATQAVPLPVCTGTFRRTMGLPCAHVMQERLEQNTGLNLEDVHEHWWIEGRPEPVPLEQVHEEEGQTLQQRWEDLGAQVSSLPALQREAILTRVSDTIQTQAVAVQNPEVVQRTRGRPVGARNRVGSSTRRDPSQFEIAERGQGARRCRVCNETGHNSRTCSNRTSIGS